MSCGSVWSQTFSYDPFGNINKSGTISFQPTYSATTNRMTSLSGANPTYDANGNLTMYDSSHTYAWDGDGNTITVEGVGVTYDALDRAVEQNRSGTYTQIVYAPAGFKLALMNGQTLNKAFVPLPGGATAVYNSGGLAYYRHPDWLGSSRLASTPSKTIYSDTAYAPFGEAYAQSGTTDTSFTGQNADTASDVYDFMYRENHPVEGRWLSADRAGGAAVGVTDPQSWNRYGYTRNSPLNLTDPSGLCDVVIGGITQAPGQPETQAQTAFANSIGADLAFPYAGGGKVSGIASVAEQSLGNQNAATATALAALKDAVAQTPAGQSVNVFTFSGGAQAFNTALNMLSGTERGRIGNVTYISPGAGVEALRGGSSGAPTVISNPLSLDTVAGFEYLVPVGTNFVTSTCGHNANCSFTAFSNLLTKRSGQQCSEPKTFTPKGVTWSQIYFTVPSSSYWFDLFLNSLPQETSTGGGGGGDVGPGSGWCPVCPLPPLIERH